MEMNQYSSARILAVSPAYAMQGRDARTIRELEVLGGRAVGGQKAAGCPKLRERQPFSASIAQVLIFELSIIHWVTLRVQLGHRDACRTQKRLACPNVKEPVNNISFTHQAQV
jgi:hypothetical protein